MPRKKIELPENERLLLCSLSGQALRDRARALSDVGWSLAAIGEALDPPRSRSTVQSWISSSSSSSSLSTIAAAEKSRPGTPLLPLPSSPSSSSSAAQRTPPSGGDGGRRRVRALAFDPARPTVAEDDAARLSELAPLARQYRSGSPPHGTYAVANDELTTLCRRLYEAGVSIPELAATAGVTYKTIEKRVKR